MPEDALPQTSAKPHKRMVLVRAAMGADLHGGFASSRREHEVVGGKYGAGEAGLPPL
jgi:hypothetical protein